VSSEWGGRGHLFPYWLLAPDYSLHKRGRGAAGETAPLWATSFWNLPDADHAEWGKRVTGGD
jgi:hypothetical protein